MHNGRLIVRHVIISLVFLVLFFVLNRPELIFISQFGLSAWYPATGLVLALMLGISPRYALLVCFSNVLAGVLFYQRNPLSFVDTAGSLGIGLAYAVAAYILRGPLRIDLELRRREDVLRYLFVSMSAAAATTLIGVGSLVVSGSVPQSEFWPASFKWFLGDGIALLGVAPFLLIQVLPRIRPRLLSQPADEPFRDEFVRASTVRSNLGTFSEGVGQLAVIVLVLWIMFGPDFGYPGMLYFGFVPIIWIAMRQGIRRVVSGILLFHFGIVVALHLFPFNAGVVPQLGLFMLVLSGIGLITGAAVSEQDRIARDLQEQTTHLNSLIENSPFGIVVLDRQGRVELINAAFEKLFLCSQAELAGRSLGTVFMADDLPADFEASVRRVIAGEARHMTVRRRRKDGRVLDLEVHALPLAVDGRVRGSYTIYKDISEHIRASQAERKHAEVLNQLLNELKRRTREMTLLSEMGDLLECCVTTEDACSVVAQSVQKLLPEVISGTLYLFKSSRNLVETAIQWGNASISEAAFSPDECWSLRRGQPHWSPLAEGIHCTHISASVTLKCLCVPMVGHGDTLGVLHLEFAGDAIETDPGSENPEAIAQRLGTTVAGQIALSLASLRLRDTLRDQSVRDPLTGLFNRRFLEESLEREMQRAVRKNHPVSILFADLDNFKRFNDTFGHDAGDYVLKIVADLFRKSVRADDVVCRYGGEEFGFILPESSSENAVIRANELREATKKMEMGYQNSSLGTLTLSIGVATFPEHGETVEELLKTADKCLYTAKSAGRDQVSLATRRSGSRDRANQPVE
jgi:diguanylate cyclase (GGDEF)-like protein/PAS domain S-box-containing protein